MGRSLCGIQGRAGTHSFQKHIERLLCVSRQARLKSESHDLEEEEKGSGLYLRTSDHKVLPCLSAFFQTNVAFNRWNFLLKE